MESIREGQRVVSVTDGDQDVLGLYREGDLVELSVMLVRSGRVIDVASFSNRRVEVPDDEVVAAFLRDHYGEGGSGEALIPEEIIVPVLPDGADGVAEWLAERRAVLVQGRHKKCELLAPARGPRKALLDMALDNARHAFEEKRRAATDIDERLLKVQERLRLPTLPRRIECCDISHFGGQDTVGAVVHLFNGLPDKKRYRTYRVRSVAEGDDYGAMFEVLGRRFRRGKDAAERAGSRPPKRARAASRIEARSATRSKRQTRQTRQNRPRTRDSAEWQLPDLFVVDGGRGQLGVALAAAHDLGLHDLPICGLAKEKENVLGDKLVDRVYLPGQKNPIPLRPNSPELFLLARARDEAHRFSNRGRKKVGKKRRLGSELDQVPGIGPKTRVALLKTLGSLAAVRVASDEAILAVPGVSKKHLSALRQWFARDTSGTADHAHVIALSPINVASIEIRSLCVACPCPCPISGSYWVDAHAFARRLLGWRAQLRLRGARGKLRGKSTARRVLIARHDVQARRARAGVLGYGVSVAAIDGGLADDFELVRRSDRTVSGRQDRSLVHGRQLGVDDGQARDFERRGARAAVAVGLSNVRRRLGQADRGECTFQRSVSGPKGPARVQSNRRHSHRHRELQPGRPRWRALCHARVGSRERR